MTKPTKWKISDILIAAGEADAAKWVKYTFRERTITQVFDQYDVTFPRVCGVTEYAWARMSYEQRCDAVVAVAKKLNVPKRAV